MGGIENPLQKPVVLFTMHTGALTALIALGKVTEFQTYFNAPFAVGCFLLGAVASVLHLYYRQLAGKDFATSVGLEEPVRIIRGTAPVRRYGVAALVVAMSIAFIALFAVDASQRETDLLKAQHATTQATSALQVAEKALGARTPRAPTVLSPSERVANARKAVREAQAAEALARAASESSGANLAITAALLALIVVPLMFVLLASSQQFAAATEKTIRGFCGAAALLSLVAFVLGLSIGAVPGITSGLAKGVAAIGDVADAPDGPKEAIQENEREKALAEDASGGPNGPATSSGPQLSGPSAPPDPTTSGTDSTTNLGGGPGDPIASGPPGQDGGTSPPRSSTDSGAQKPPGKSEPVVAEGPRGPPGPPGPRGPPGPAGPAGRDGVTTLTGPLGERPAF